LYICIGGYFKTALIELFFSIMIFFFIKIFASSGESSKN
jgi:hypothetical protein